MSRRAISGLTFLIFGFFLLSISVFYSLPSNVVSDRGAKNPIRILSIDMAPQGWAFFTKPPSEGELLYYSSDSLESLLVTPQGRIENLFGISRTQRAQGPEVAQLLKDIADEDWYSCNSGESIYECFDAMKANNYEAYNLENNSPIKTLCGDVLVSNALPTPWSYRDLVNDTYIPKNIVSLNIQC
ncbi:SdpA family antimicrobial peptide system protein [Rothia nasisuis]|uniref:SdpA family antimicrobial peptide system protein n=1 Tax=Rothia nasisuis TaxID=2109647 RepID=UPI001F2C0860|nr:SdpA family antimicrobial peptide system protein [Rothia nasisuis]